MKKVHEMWPSTYEPRLNQLKAMLWLEKNKDKKYLILEAPVGAGKSDIGVTLSLATGRNAFVLTPQRILQEQYEESFNDNKNIDLSSFYGKSNYDCPSKGASCAIGGLVKPKCSDCTYTNAKNKAIDSNATVMNYALALGIWGYTSVFKNTETGRPLTRNLMVLDECHTLEEHLVNFDSISVSEWRCNKYNISWKAQTDLQQAVDWLRTSYHPAMLEVIDTMESEVEMLQDKNSSDLSKPEIKKLEEFDQLSSHVYDDIPVFLDMDISDMENNYVLVNDKITFEFKRLTGEHSFHAIVEPMADQFLFMSSTILNHRGFCSDLGIDLDDVAFLSLQSEFDVAKRPVYYMPQMKMNYKWSSDENTSNRAGMVSCIQQLLTMHDGQSGIIHTANFKIAEWLVKELSGNITQQIFHHNPDSGDDRNSIIKAFMASPKPGVLISPSSTEGLDLKEDLGRYAIFVKTPFGNMGDQWIKRRMEMSNEWYQRRAMIDIIQGGGRIVRGPEDHGTTYILDESFGHLHRQAYHNIPKWWKEGFTQI